MIRTIALVALGGALAATSVTAPEQAGPPSSAPPVSTPEGFARAHVSLVDADGQRDRIDVWLADTGPARGRGLMGVTDLGDADGMIFVFDRAANWQFYMWQTLIPLSIAYFDDDGRFVAAEEMSPCTTDTAAGCERYSPGVSYRFAIEVPGGDLDRLGIDEGDRIESLVCGDEPDGSVAG